MRKVLIFTTIFVAICALWFFLKPREVSDITAIDIKDSFLGTEWSGSPYWNSITVKRNPKHPKCQIAEAYYMNFERLYPNKKGFLPGYLFIELRKFIKSNDGIITEDSLNNPSLNSGGYSIDFKLNHSEISSSIELGSEGGATLIVCINPSKK
jgi:hypothetical protein